MSTDLATWDAALAAWRFSLGTHDHGAQDCCDCEYTWACPTCGSRVTALGGDMGTYEATTGGECQGCAWA